MVLKSRLPQKLFNLKSPIGIVSTGIITSAFIYLGTAFLAAVLSLWHKQPDPSIMLVDRYNTFIATIENQDTLFGYWPLPDTLPSTTL